MRYPLKHQKNIFIRRNGESRLEYTRMIMRSDLKNKGFKAEFNRHLKFLPTVLVDNIINRLNAGKVTPMPWVILSGNRDDRAAVEMFKAQRRKTTQMTTRRRVKSRR